MPDPRLPLHQPDLAPNVPALGGVAWAHEHGPVPPLTVAKASVGAAAPLGSMVIQKEAMAEGTCGRGVGAQAPLQPVQARAFSSRVFIAAAVGAVVLHGAVLVCLLSWVHAPPPAGAPGEKAVQMVFETQASRPTPPPAAAPPVTAANAPPMQMEDTPPPITPPPLPLGTEALPDMPLFTHQPEAKLPATKPKPQAAKAMVHSARHAPTVAADAKTMPNHAPTTQDTTPAPPAAQVAPASTAQSAKGADAMALHCTPPQTHYPALARRLHEEGEAVVEVFLAATGAVQAVHLTKSTGYDDLDAQALAAARALRCTPPQNGARAGRIPVGFHIQ